MQLDYFTLTLSFFFSYLNREPLIVKPACYWRCRLTASLARNREKKGRCRRFLNLLGNPTGPVSPVLGFHQQRIDPFDPILDFRAETGLLSYRLLWLLMILFGGDGPVRSKSIIIFGPGHYLVQFGPHELHHSESGCTWHRCFPKIWATFWSMRGCSSHHVAKFWHFPSCCPFITSYTPTCCLGKTKILVNGD